MFFYNYILFIIGFIFVVVFHMMCAACIIINTSSIAAFDGQIGQAAYAASKGGVASLTLPMARDLSSKGIRVVSIAPGVFETPMLEAMPKEIQHNISSQIPFPNRLGKPEEFAFLILRTF